MTQHERIYGSEAFIKRTRDPRLPIPERRVVRTVKQPGDVVIGGSDKGTAP